MIRGLFNWFSKRSQDKRARLLAEVIRVDASTNVLDLGGGVGKHIASRYPHWRDVTICDLNLPALEEACRRGFKAVAADGTQRLPLCDGEFGFCFCSSVIEHVTGPKDGVRAIKDDSEFASVAKENQRKFAEEIRRISQSYFVQTPYRYFPVESHTWLPAVILLLPRGWMLGVVAFTNRFWPKKASPDWYLLSKAEMAALFPDAKIYVERFLGMPRSLIAVRTGMERRTARALHPLPFQPRRRGS
jgi:hypothetical protein